MPSFHGNLSIFFGELSTNVFCPFLFFIFIYLCCPFLNWVLVFYFFDIELHLYILEINPLSVAAFANIFSLLVFYFVSFGVQKLLSIIKFPLFLFIFQYSKTWIKKDSSAVYVRVLFFFWPGHATCGILVP